MLKWSLQYHDKTNTEETPILSPEQQSWLKQALSSLDSDEVSEMKAMIIHLQNTLKDKSKLDESLALLE